MNITKFGHCCLLIEHNNIRILTDPGTFSTGQDSATNIDIIVITHEHADHFHIESVKKILKNNPEAKIITNSAVGTLLDKEGLKYRVVENGQKSDEYGISIEGIGEKHAEIYKTIPAVQNTGYMIANKLFYPGDAFPLPGRAVDILALPVAGPWMKISEALDFALTVKPRVAFPVHEAIMASPGFAHRLPSMVLPQAGIEFVVIEVGATKEL